MTEQLIILIEIILIDLVLAGDNAIIIGMVASKFPLEQRKKIIFWGIGAAIVLRIIFTLITAYLLQITGLFNVEITSINSRREEEHFLSREEPSYKRLIEMIEESSYWTSYLQKVSSKVMIFILLILAAITFCIFGAAIVSFQSDSLITLSRAIIAIMLFVISSDALGLLIGYKNSASAIDDIFKRVEVASIKGYSKSDALLLMSDYNAIIEKAPSTLPFVYKFIHVSLNRRWQTYIEEKKH